MEWQILPKRIIESVTCENKNQNEIDFTEKNHFSHANLMMSGQQSIIILSLFKNSTKEQIYDSPPFDIFVHILRSHCVYYDLLSAPFLIRWNADYSILVGELSYMKGSTMTSLYEGGLPHREIRA